MSVEIVIGIMIVIMIVFLFYCYYVCFRCQKSGFILNKGRKKYSSVRISILGLSCSGKSTLSSVLTRIFKIDSIELDSINFIQNCIELSKDDFVSKTLQRIGNLESNGFVVDGNYFNKLRNSRVFEMIDLVIWIDYSFVISFSRLIWRSLNRALLRKKVCGENYETFHQIFCSRQSLIFQILKHHYSVICGQKKKMEINKEFFKSIDVECPTIIRVISPFELRKVIEMLKSNYDDLFLPV